MIRNRIGKYFAIIKKLIKAYGVCFNKLSKLQKIKLLISYWQ